MKNNNHWFIFSLALFACFLVGYVYSSGCGRVVPSASTSTSSNSSSSSVSTSSSSTTSTYWNIIEEFSGVIFKDVTGSDNEIVFGADYRFSSDPPTDTLCFVRYDGTWNMTYESDGVAGFSRNVNQICYDGSGYYYATSNGPGSIANIYRSLDGGTTWESFSITPAGPVAGDLYGLFVLDANTIWASNSQGIYYTIEAVSPSNWETMGQPSELMNNSPVGMKFFDLLTGVVMLTNSSGPNISQIWQTSNGGLNWRTSMSSPYQYNAISFNSDSPSTAVVFVAGNNGVVEKSIDSGENWEHVSNIPAPANTDNFSDIFIVPGSTEVWISGSHYILHSTNEGSSWRVWDITFPSTDNFACIYSRSGETWGATTGGRIYYHDGR
jgi:photosystem II stability/assembly factor-like uncharacterized protein